MLLLATASLALLAAAPIGAQSGADPLTSGRRVRISWEARGLSSQLATVVRLRQDTLTVRARFGDASHAVTETLHIPLADVDLVEYATTVTAPPSTATNRLVLGAGVGVVLGALLGGTGGGAYSGVSRSANVVAGLEVGGLAGFLIGAARAQPDSLPPADDGKRWTVYCSKPCRR